MHDVDEVPVLLDFRAYIQSKVAIQDDLWQVMTEAMKVVKVHKGERLLEKGVVCKHIYFIYKGAFRFLYLKDEEEITTALYTKGVCMTNMKSLATLQPSSIIIQSLEDGIIVRMGKEFLIQLYKKATGLEAVGRVITEHMVAEDMEWKEMYTIYNPEQRYQFLLKKSPEILQKVPLQYVASFLGMRRETLSRIRGRVSRPS